jgi:hypothetical protein
MQRAKIDVLPRRKSSKSKMSAEGAFYPQLAYRINILERYDYEVIKSIFVKDVYRSMRNDIHNCKAPLKEVYRSIKNNIHNCQASLLQQTEIKFMLYSKLAYPSIYITKQIYIYKTIYSKILQEVYGYSKKDADHMIKDALDCLATQ